ncbi:hypothetical protein [Falsirhodobacter sp. alg1]|uniref:hypothetical protein n=1 Tax=Falsirhodobacter sp. alg1 TaxID=1472418 RepID=UPI0005F01E9E|nr:hypothetical protein [Falsirhodobacter sp. alg1]
MDDAENTMSPLEAMKAWARGEIRTRDALTLTGSDTLYHLYAACAASGVSLYRDLIPQEQVDLIASMNLIL